MAHGPEQIRLAITVFNAPEDLESTLQALKAEGFESAQLCLAASEASLTGLSQKVAAAPVEFEQLHALIEHVGIWPGLADGHRVVATSGPLLDLLARGQQSASEQGHGSKSAIDDELVLKAQIGTGGMVLVVRSSTPAQHVAATRALLRESSHSVRTYDFTIAAS